VVKVPIIGIGGIMTGEDAIEFLLAGASAVQVGTATFAQPDAALQVIQEIENYCRQHNVASVNDLMGSVRV
jgi:dihydroorotate dehydrogenase (NAD+) catalytic subunit